MIKKIKKEVKRLLLSSDHSTKFFSQGGEDAILRMLFNKKFAVGEKGFYVDVGAYHPYIHSNTYYFYQHGWKGINIDARPGSMKTFEKLRKRDINLEIGIGLKDETSTFYQFDETSTINTFSKSHLERNNLIAYIKKESTVEVKRLETILESFNGVFKQIDFLSIDVEGLGHEVLLSNNWKKFKPNVIVIELECMELDDTLENKSSIFLMEMGYRLVAKNIILKDVSSVFFVSKDFNY